MHRFWDSIIEPLFTVLRPEVVVEIGSNHGPNTQNLLQFCQQRGAKLHVIDPLPKYDVADWKERYGEHVVFHLSLSLDAISSIDRFDAVLIDGDHNWYTVFNELKLIEERCEDSSQPFPLVMLHDVGWPYGRRDVYYDPDRIPESYLNPYERKGMQPGSTELQEEGGFNRGFHNAVREGGPRNGVLTAVEDFLEQTEHEVDLVQVPGLHGLGILVSSLVKEQASGFLKTLDLPSNIIDHIERVEEAYLEAEIARQESDMALRRLEAKRSKEVERLQSQLQKQK